MILVTSLICFGTSKDIFTCSVTSIYRRPIKSILAGRALNSKLLYVEKFSTFVSYIHIRKISVHCSCCFLQEGRLNKDFLNIMYNVLYKLNMQYFLIAFCPSMFQRELNFCISADLRLLFDLYIHILYELAPVYFIFVIRFFSICPPKSCLQIINAMQ